MDYRWLHELVFGALLGNLLLGLSFLRFAFKVYKQAAEYKERHRLMWVEYCKKHHRIPGREFNVRSDFNSTAKQTRRFEDESYGESGE
jgi:hypothetical protein